MNKKEKWNKFMFSFLEISGAILFAYYANNNQIFCAMQSLFFCLSLLIPMIIQFIFKIKIAPFMFIIYESFLIAHFIFGEIFSFYVTFQYYDMILHFLSAICICIFGYSIIHYYLNFSFYSLQLFFAFLFGLASEFFWEIIEYTADEIFQTNMQRYIQNQQLLSGHFALTDTIKDMIVATLGCFLFLLLCKISKIQNVKITKI